MLGSGLLNVMIERVAYRPLRDAPKLAALITAVGMSFILQNVGLLWRGGSQEGITDLVQAQKQLFSIGGVSVSNGDLLAVGVTIPLVLLMTAFITRSRLGKAMRATAQDPEAARLMGINVDRIVMFSFGLAALFGAGAGVLVAPVIQASASMGVLLGLKGFAVAIIGGITSGPGVVLGAHVAGGKRQQG